MFETLTERLTGSFSFFKNKKELTEANIDEGLAAVRQALLEADVHFKLAREFTERVKERALGEQRLRDVAASDQFVHAVHAELVELMGPEDATLAVAKTGPTVILMAGLQGQAADIDIHAKEILTGGRLALIMGPEPNKAWGARAGDAPPGP